ncbi:MAG: exopolysaccharide biosynthesis polyprenyl glycosylphosphotransferase [Candidatus Rokubacteria bacterium]|nr:exopolysaccharide biosynthesis polyprenyl glycosylphosphotransferase [Candidatus Rokubacteria bacterium]
MKTTETLPASSAPEQFVRRNGHHARSGHANADHRAERVLIVGTTPLTEKVVQELERPDRRSAVIVGVVPDADPGPGARYAILGPIDRLDKIVRETRPHRIIVDVAHGREVPVTALVESLGVDVIVEDAVDVYERLTGTVPLHALRPEHVIFSKSFAGGWAQAAFARALSLVGGIIGLIVFAPLFLLVAIAITRDDPAGPVFFVQPRLGRGGRPFNLLKFRTMRAGTRPSEWVCDNSHRITRVGRWLRRFRLDELPQLVNVLRGEMDLVGPRPHPVSNARLFIDGIPFYPLRLLVRPGITGWAQVEYGYANSLEEETEKMRYDLYYIKHRSVALDLRILVKTFTVVLTGHGVEGSQERDERPVREAA